ncbi:MAG: hypothetical protein MK111_12175 [Crocosphaera sp.]|nr:hypothetical protein [Crocosphaera sp.]MCH2228074.1 hypothetical protein [Candidatus Caenarcaniphilales bacterium]MCH2245384.1 hypothetical protein [Crocosphaera sp.]
MDKIVGAGKKIVETTATGFLRQAGKDLYKLASEKSTGQPKSKDQSESKG